MIGDLIAGPIGQVLGIILILIVYSIIAGAMNGWYTQTVDAGVIGAERFDRVVGYTGTETPDEAWAGATAGSGNAVVDGSFYKLEKNADDCALVGVTSALGSGIKLYTPAGTDLENKATLDTKLELNDCEWRTAAKVLKAGGLGAVITIVLQAAGLALPVGVLAMLGGFGGSLMRRFGGDALTTIIVAVVVVVLSAILFNYFVPFVEDAYRSIDPNRFIIYDEGLGSLGVVVGNFWGVTLVASMMGVAWTLVQSLRPANLLHGRGGRM